MTTEILYNQIEPLDPQTEAIITIERQSLECGNWGYDDMPSVSHKVELLEQRLGTAISVTKWGVTVLIMLLAWLFLAAYNQNQQLARIEEQIKKSTTTTVEKLVEAAKGNPTQAQSAMTLAASVIATARKNGLAADKASLRQLGMNLRNVPAPLRQTSAYWEATGQYVSYRSENETQQQKASKQPNSIPNCYDKKPSDAGISITQDRKTISINGPLVYDFCVLQLDGDKERRFSGEIAGKPPIFRNCIIRYSGGVVALSVGTVFQNCKFEFTLDSPPPPDGQRFTDALLVANSLDFVQVPPG